MRLVCETRAESGAFFFKHPLRPAGLQKWVVPRRMGPLWALIMGTRTHKNAW